MISKNTEKALEQIAMNESYALECRGGLEDRYNDEEDFEDMSICSIRAMLEKAYLLGLKNGKAKH